MSLVVEAFVPGRWAADVMLAEDDWVASMCVGVFESERRAERAASRARPTLVQVGDVPGVAVVVEGQRHVHIADQLDIRILTSQARQRQAELWTHEDPVAPVAWVESDYEPVGDNDVALALLLARHGTGYAPRQMGVGVRWMPLDLPHEDEQAEIVTTGDELPDSLREDLLFEAIAEDAIMRRRRKD